MPKIISERTKKIILERLEKGIPISRIAGKANVSEATVRNLRRSAGIPRYQIPEHTRIDKQICLTRSQKQAVLRVHLLERIVKETIDKGGFRPIDETDMELLRTIAWAKGWVEPDRDVNDHPDLRWRVKWRATPKTIRQHKQIIAKLKKSLGAQYKDNAKGKVALRWDPANESTYGEDTKHTWTRKEAMQDLAAKLRAI